MVSFSFHYSLSSPSKEFRKSEITDLGQARRSLAITVEQVQGAIPNDAVLVEYVRYGHYLGKSKGESRYAAVLLSPGSSPHWFTLGSTKEIEAAHRRYQVLVRTESSSPAIKFDFAMARFFKNPMHRSGLALAGANSDDCRLETGRGASHAD